MTAKLDGTNGLLQQYDFQTPTTGFSYTFAAGVNVLVMNPAGTLATGTITMPAAPVDGMTITVESTQQITALTVQGNTGQSLVNGTQTLRPNQPYSWVYRLSNTTWYPFAGATNSQLVSGTVQTAPPPTPQYFDFTGIPSWVKRVTINFSGVSTTGSSNYQIQLGTSGGIQSTGYLVNATQITLAAAASTTATSGFRFGSSAYNGTTDIFNGMCQFCLLDSSNGTWSGFGCIGNSASTQSYFTAGSKVLSGTLDRVRITTAGGADTFDAGSINILYE